MSQDPVKHRIRAVLFHAAVVAIIFVFLLAAALELCIRFLAPETLAPPPMDRPMAIYAAQSNREHPHTANATNAWRIAIVGDSAAVGTGNHRLDRFASRLEWLLNLNNSTPPVEVEVFAKPTATYQQKALLEKALEYNPRIVIFSIHINDTEDWSNAGEFMAIRKLMSERAAPKFLRPILRRSVLLKLIYQRRQRDSLLKHTRRYYALIYDPTYSGLAKFKAALAQYRDMCLAKGVVMVTMIQPHLKWDPRPGFYPFEQQHLMISEICRNLNIPCLDTLEAFRYSSPLRNMDVPIADPHPSEIANRIMADALFHGLLDLQIVPREYIPLSRVDKLVIRNWIKKAQALEIPVPDL